MIFKITNYKINNFQWHNRTVFVLFGSDCDCFMLDRSLTAFREAVAYHQRAAISSDLNELLFDRPSSFRQTPSTVSIVSSSSFSSFSDVAGLELATNPSVRDGKVCQV